MSTTTRHTNEYLGRLVGLSHATVSRLRSGSRLPSLPAMTRIATVTGWSEQDQIEARKEGTYAKHFEEAVAALLREE